MDNNHSTLTELFTDIADAIREKSPPSDIVVFEGEAHDGDTGKKYRFFKNDITVCSGLVAGETYTVKFGKDTYPDCTAEEDSDGRIVLNTSEHEIRYTPGVTELTLVYYDWSKYGAFEYVPLTIYKPGTPSAIVADQFPDAIRAIEAGGDITEMEDGLVMRTITEYSNDRVTKIGSSAFYDYDDLTSVNCPAASYIGANAFYSCYNLTTANLPLATTILDRAFASCTNLKNVNLPKNVNLLGEYAFAGCSSLASVDFQEVGTVGAYAFSNCKNLVSVNLPAARSIKSNAFFGCSGLTSIILPAAKQIGSNAFAKCSKLSSVEFPALTSIYSTAFISCSKLTSFVIGAASVASLGNSNAFNDTPMVSSGYTGAFGSIYVPASLLASYQAAKNWSYFSSRFVGV